MTGKEEGQSVSQTAAETTPQLHQSVAKAKPNCRELSVTTEPERDNPDKAETKAAASHHGLYFWVIFMYRSWDYIIGIVQSMCNYLVN